MAAGATLSLNHVAEDTLVVPSTPVSLPRQRQRDANGQLVTDPSTNLPAYLTPSHAVIYVGGQPVRWRADGTAPVSMPGGGMFVAAGSYIYWTDPLGDFTALIQNARFCRAEGSTDDGVLEISFFA